MNALAPAVVLAVLNACAAPTQDPAPAPPAPAPETTDTTLLADYAESRVLEVDMQGKVVWSFGEVTGPWGVERLDNDHVLVTEFAGSRVREVDRQGKTVWSFEDLKNPRVAHRLPNGNTLIAAQGAVREYDRAGKVVWTFASRWAVAASRCSAR